MTPLLVLRPEPGASATAARARALGLCPVVAPLFAIAPVAWTPPDPAGFDALLLTSANAARHAGPALARLSGLPVYAVGDATAAAARAAGLVPVHVGEGDAAAVARPLAADRRTRVLHLCGIEHRALPGMVVIESLPVYRSVACDALPDAARGVAGGAVALVHSPRAGATFARLFDEAGLDRRVVALAAISAAAGEAAGGGWRACAIAAAPNDPALLAQATRLCDDAC